MSIGGIEKVLLTLANEFADEHEVLIVVCSGKDHFVANDKYRIVGLNSKLRNCIGKLGEVIAGERPDIFITGGDGPNIVAALVKRKSISRGVKFVLTQHNYMNTETYHNKTIHKIIMRIAYHNSDSVVAVSAGVKDFLMSDFHLDESRVSIIYNPIPLRNIEIMAKSTEESKLVDECKPYILFCGRFSVVKNIPLLINAFSRLPDKGINLVLIGDGEERDAVHELVSRMYLDDRVFFRGTTTNVFPWVKGSEITALSSESEAFPIFCLESFAMGKILVSTPTKGVEEAYGNMGKKYVAIKNNNIAAYADVLEKGLLDCKKEYITSELIKKSLDFDSKIVAKKYIGLFSWLLVGGKRE